MALSLVPQLQETRTCRQCGVEKPYDMFRNRGKLRGYQCKACHSAYVQARRDPEKCKVQYAAYYPKHAARMNEESKRRWKALDLETRRARSLAARLRRDFGMTVEDYERMLVAQNGVCAICRRAETYKNRSGCLVRLSVDHDHDSGEVRGLLCRACNSGLGQLGDSSLLLRAAVDYLERRRS